MNIIGDKNYFNIDFRYPDEKFRWIKGYENKYQVSNYGRIKSFLRLKPKILKPKINYKGYLHVQLKQNLKNFRISRVVASNFLENPNNYKEVNHINCDKLNNHSTNLEFCTHKYNMNHAKNNKLMNAPKGEKVYNASLKDQDIFKIKKLIENKFTHKEIAEIFNVNKPVIDQIAIGNTWLHLNLGFNSEKRIGENHHNSKLTKNQIIEIRQLFINGKKPCDIYRKFNIGKTTFYNIIRERTWKHIEI